MAARPETRFAGIVIAASSVSGVSRSMSSRIASSLPTCTGISIAAITSRRSRAPELAREDAEEDVEARADPGQQQAAERFALLRCAGGTAKRAPKK